MITYLCIICISTFLFTLFLYFNKLWIHTMYCILSENKQVAAYINNEGIEIGLKIVIFFYFTTYFTIMFKDEWTEICSSCWYEHLRVCWANNLQEAFSYSRINPMSIIGSLISRWTLMFIGWSVGWSVGWYVRIGTTLSCSN